MKGYISLYKVRGDHVKTLPFMSARDRNQIIERWRKSYGKGFNKCFLQISLTYKTNAVFENGLNKKSYEDD